MNARMTRVAKLLIGDRWERIGRHNAAADFGSGPIRV